MLSNAKVDLSDIKLSPIVHNNITDKSNKVYFLSQAKKEKADLSGIELRTNNQNNTNLEINEDSLSKVVVC